MTTSKEFTFIHNNETYTAYVRYYDDGEHDVEVVGDDAPAVVYDVAWQVAESLELLIEDGYYGDGHDDSGDYGDNV